MSARRALASRVCLEALLFDGEEFEGFAGESGGSVSLAATLRTRNSRATPRERLPAYC